MSNSHSLLFKQRATVSKSLWSLFTNEWQEQITLYQRVTDLSLSKNKRLPKTNLSFSPCFWQLFTLFTLFMPKSKQLPWLFAPSLFFKERREWFAHGRSLRRVIFKKSIASKLLLSSFAHKKRAIRWKNQRGNSQPWIFTILLVYQKYIEEDIFKSKSCETVPLIFKLKAVSMKYLIFLMWAKKRNYFHKV